MVIKRVATKTKACKARKRVCKECAGAKEARHVIAYDSESQTHGALRTSALAKRPPIPGGTPMWMRYKLLGYSPQKYLPMMEMEKGKPDFNKAFKKAKATGKKEPVRSDSVRQKGTQKKTPIKNWYLEEFGYHKIKVVRGKANGDKPKKSASHKRFFGPWSTKEQASALVHRGSDFAWGKPSR